MQKQSRLQIFDGVRPVARKHTLFLNVVKETYNKDPSLCMYPKKYPLTSSVAYYLNPGGTCEKKWGWARSKRGKGAPGGKGTPVCHDDEPVS